MKYIQGGWWEVGGARWRPGEVEERKGGGGGKEGEFETWLINGQKQNTNRPITMASMTER